MGNAASMFRAFVLLCEASCSRRPTKYRNTWYRFGARCPNCSIQCNSYCYFHNNLFVSSFIFLLPTINPGITQRKFANQFERVPSPQQTVCKNSYYTDAKNFARTFNDGNRIYLFIFSSKIVNSACTASCILILSVKIFHKFVNIRNLSQTNWLNRQVRRASSKRRFHSHFHSMVPFHGQSGPKQRQCPK